MNVFIFHGTGGYPQENWFPWLKNELEKESARVLEQLKKAYLITKSVSRLIGTPRRLRLTLTSSGEISL